MPPSTASVRSRKDACTRSAPVTGRRHPPATDTTALGLTASVRCLRQISRNARKPMPTNDPRAQTPSDTGLWCSYCRKADHSDAQCWCTRPADWDAHRIPSHIATSFSTLVGHDPRPSSPAVAGPTPRTDGIRAKWSRNGGNRNGCDASPEARELYEHADQLERELAAALHRLERHEGDEAGPL
jgi:hypothetical protein